MWRDKTHAARRHAARCGLVRFGANADEEGSAVNVTSLAKLSFSALEFAHQGPI
jgi:hypothetical protein